MFSHLVDQEARHFTVRVLSNHILDFSANYFPTAIFPCNCFYKVNFNVGVNIVSQLISHRL